MLFGKEVNGAQRWLDLGFFTLQASEIIKIALPVFLAAYLYDKPLPINLFQTFITLALILTIVNLIRVQPDLGTSLVILVAGLYILFLAGLSWRFIGISFGIFILSLPFIWNNFLEPFQRQRILTLLDPSADPYGSGWNITQSKIAIGSGGLEGKGYQMGSQAHLDFLPETETDFIFSVIAEEFGFIGTIFIIFLFLLLISVCFYISVKSNHIFGRILSIGVGSNLFIYVIMNISMVSGLMPVVGIPLPLVSYGGSAMLAIIISLGLVLNAELNGNLKKISNA